MDYTESKTKVSGRVAVDHVADLSPDTCGLEVTHVDERGITVLRRGGYTESFEVGPRQVKSAVAGIGKFLSAEPHWRANNGVEAARTRNGHVFPFVFWGPKATTVRAWGGAERKPHRSTWRADGKALKGRHSMQHHMSRLRRLERVDGMPVPRPPLRSSLGYFRWGLSPHADGPIASRPPPPLVGRASRRSRRRPWIRGSRVVSRCGRRGCAKRGRRGCANSV